MQKLFCILYEEVCDKMVKDTTIYRNTIYGKAIYGKLLWKQLNASGGVFPRTPWTKEGWPVCTCCHELTDHLNMMNDGNHLCQKCFEEREYTSKW